MKQSFTRALAAVLAFFLGSAAVVAQITIPNTFTPGTTISSSQMNANFTAVAAALNRAGGTMTGTLISQQITPSSTATYDLGTTLVKFRDAWFSRNVALGGDLTVTGSITAGSGAVGITDATGKIPAISSTYFASLDASNLTSIPSGQLTPALATVPSGLVAFSTTGSCPSGWTEYTTARGRYIVGLVSGGTNGATVGTSLSNSEDRAVGQHTHSVTDPGHVHDQQRSTSGAGATTDFEIATNRNTTYTASASDTASATTGISIQNSGSVAGTNAPYVQLIACQKS